MADDEGPMFLEPNDGITRIEKLPRWSDSKPMNLASAPVPEHNEDDSSQANGAQKTIKFTYDHAINKKIVLW